MSEEINNGSLRSPHGSARRKQSDARTKVRPRRRTDRGGSDDRRDARCSTGPRARAASARAIGAVAGHADPTRGAGLPPPSFAGPPAPSPPLLVPALPPGTVAPSPSGSATDEPVLAPVALEPGVVQRVLELSRPYLMAWTLAILILGLHGLVHRGGAEFRQPGMAACGVATLVLAVQLSAILLRWAVEWSWAAADAWRRTGCGRWGQPRLRLSRTSGSQSMRDLSSPPAPGTQSPHWLIMVLGGWWRPEPSAIDRLGRALGVAWIAVMAARVVQNFGVYVW